MSICKLRKLDDAHFVLEGVLDFASVPELLRLDGNLFKAADAIQIDLQGVTQSNSAGLALLLEWLAKAKKLNKQLSFHNIPQQLLQIAGLSDLDDFLLAGAR